MKVDSMGVETVQAETPLLHLPDSDEQRARYVADQAPVVDPLGARPLHNLLNRTLFHEQAADQMQASTDVFWLHQLQQRLDADISAAQSSLRFLQAQRERLARVHRFSQIRDSTSTYLTSQIHQLASHLSPVGFNQSSMLDPNRLVAAPTSPNVASFFTSAEPKARATNQKGPYAEPVKSISVDVVDRQEFIKNAVNGNITVPRGTGATSVDNNDTPGESTSSQSLTKKRHREVSNSEIASDDRYNDGLDDGAKNEGRFRNYQEENWEKFFIELRSYRDRTGNCFVPQKYKANEPLARWVKRQRYQYNAMMDGMPSQMAEERVKALEDIGFVWCSQDATWAERLYEIKQFRQTYNHCNVPTNYCENPSLANWVKNQRLQYKFFIEGKPSNITGRRISDLEDIGFNWAPRRGRPAVPNKPLFLYKTPFFK
jgi:hypothetical protein